MAAIYCKSVKRNCSPGSSALGSFPAHDQPGALGPRGEVHAIGDLRDPGPVAEVTVDVISRRPAGRRHGEHRRLHRLIPVSYTHLRAHETVLDLVCRLLLEKKKKKT